jgi:hypothetical protein
MATFETMAANRGDAFTASQARIGYHTRDPKEGYKMSDEIKKMNDAFEKFTAGKKGIRTSISLEALAVIEAMRDAINELGRRSTGFLGNPDVLGSKDILK